MLPKIPSRFGNPEPFPGGIKSQAELAAERNAILRKKGLLPPETSPVPVNVIDELEATLTGQQPQVPITQDEVSTPVSDALRERLSGYVKSTDRRGQEIQAPQPAAIPANNQDRLEQLLVEQQSIQPTTSIEQDEISQIWKEGLEDWAKKNPELARRLDKSSPDYISREEYDDWGWKVVRDRNDEIKKRVRQEVTGNPSSEFNRPKKRPSRPEQSQQEYDVIKPVEPRIAGTNPENAEQKYWSKFEDPLDLWGQASSEDTLIQPAIKTLEQNLTTNPVLSLEAQRARREAVGGVTQRDPNAINKLRETLRQVDISEQTPQLQQVAAVEHIASAPVYNPQPLADEFLDAANSANRVDSPDTAEISGNRYQQQKAKIVQLQAKHANEWDTANPQKAAIINNPSEERSSIDAFIAYSDEKENYVQSKIREATRSSNALPPSPPKDNISQLEAMLDNGIGGNTVPPPPSGGSGGGRVPPRGGSSAGLPGGYDGPDPANFNPPPPKDWSGIPFENFEAGEQLGLNGVRSVEGFVPNLKAGFGFQSVNKVDPATGERVGTNQGYAARPLIADIWKGTKPPADVYNDLSPIDKLGFNLGRLGGDVFNVGTQHLTWRIHPLDLTSTKSFHYLRDAGTSPAIARAGAYAASNVLGLASNNWAPWNLDQGGRQPGFAAISPDDRDPRESTNPLGDLVFNRGILGRTGRLLPWEQFHQERPETSYEDYLDYQNYLKDPGFLGLVKGTLDGVDGPEARLMGYRLTPLGVAAAAGTAYGFKKIAQLPYLRAPKVRQ